jgi:hypothetical protein
MTGLFSDPLFGVAFATLKEINLRKNLSLTILKVDLGLPPMADLEVKVWGPTRVSPGQTIDLIVEYRNDGLSSAYETVVVVLLPSKAEYISSTSEGIYRWETHEEVWKLGTIQPREKGNLSVRVYFPWGIPNQTSQWALASYETSSVEKDHFLNPGKVLFDLRDYLLYEPVEVINQKTLTAQEFAIELSSDAEFKDLYEYAAESGFVCLVATRTTFNTGSRLLEVIMANLADEVTILTKIDDTSFLKAFSETGVSYSDRGGGMSLDLDTYSMDSWGLWAIPGSPTRAQCITNCLINKGSEWVITNRIRLVNVILATPDCVSCIMTGNLAPCGKCTSALADIPGVGEVIDVGECIADCREDPTSHACSEDKKYCGRGFWDLLGVESVKIMRCDTATGNYLPGVEEIVCPLGDICKDGECVNGTDLCGTSSYCNIHDFEVVTARDPSVKYGPEGRVLAWQRLNYRVEYENEGEGIAYGVYFTDTLDVNLDDSTLEIGSVRDVNTGDQIGGVGTYDPNTRTLTWFAGQVDPNQGGYAEFSVNVGRDVPIGTEIINYATVYFPSVPEETRTNGIVSTVTIPGDIDGDLDVDFGDYAVVANQWLQLPVVPSADIAPAGGDGIVDFRDLAVLADYWLEGATP